MWHDDEREMAAGELENILVMEGVQAILLVRMDDGELLLQKSSSGCGIDLRLAARAYAQVLRAQAKIVKLLGQQDVTEDIQITMRHACHLLHVIDEHAFLMAVMLRDEDGSSALGMLRLVMSQACERLAKLGSAIEERDD